MKICRRKMEFFREIEDINNILISNIEDTNGYLKIEYTIKDHDGTFYNVVDKYDNLATNLNNKSIDVVVINGFTIIHSDSESIIYDIKDRQIEKSKGYVRYITDYKIVLKENNKCYLIDKKSNSIMGIFDDVSYLDAELAIVTVNNKKKLIKIKTMKVIAESSISLEAILPRKGDAGYFSIKNKDYTFNIIDRDGKTTHTDVKYIYNNHILVKEGNNIVVYDSYMTRLATLQNQNKIINFDRYDVGEYMVVEKRSNRTQIYTSDHKDKTLVIDTDLIESVRKPNRMDNRIFITNIYGVEKQYYITRGKLTPCNDKSVKHLLDTLHSYKQCTDEVYLDNISSIGYINYVNISEELDITEM